LSKLQIVQGELKTLSPANEAKLRKRIIEKGFDAPFFVWGNKILDGTQRKKVLDNLLAEGWAIDGGKVPVCDIKAKSLAEAKDRLLGYVWQYGKITVEGLSDFLASVPDVVLDLDSLDMPDFDLEQFRRKYIDKTTERTDDDAVPDRPKKPKTKRGDLYLLGDHRLLCGDATDAADVERVMDGKKAALVMADPPYNVDYVGGSTNKKARSDAHKDKWTDDSYTMWLASTLKNTFALSDSKSALLIWFASAKMRMILDAYECAGWVSRTLIVWNKLKPHYGALGAQYKYRFELMWYCYKKGQSPRFYGATNECTVWDIEQPRVNDLHPTMKPVQLYERCIQNHTAKGEIVLEVFSGSGTTLIAAEKLNRKCYGLEIDPIYCDVIVERWENYTGRKAKLERKSLPKTKKKR
jgi:DNA modification methylase